MDILRTKTLKALDSEIERLIEALSLLDPSSEQYLKVSDNLRALCEAREKKNPLQVNLDAIIAVSANILGLIIVLNFEKTNVITTKAFGMIFKGKS